MRYRTIVADPPWEYPEGFALGPGHGQLEVRPLPYPSMPFDDICSLRVHELAEDDCRLFLWTTNRWLDDAFVVMRAWRFKYRQTLVWHKTDANLPASVAPNSAEFILVGTRGAPERLSTMPSSVIATTRSGGHSTKPEAWLDYFEAVSPGPYLEMFARRNRIGWDTWGNQSLNHLEDKMTTAIPEAATKLAEELRAAGHDITEADLLESLAATRLSLVQGHDEAARAYFEHLTENLVQTGEEAA